MKNRILIATLLSTFLLATSNVQAANFTDNQTVDSNKTWTIKFTGSVEFDESTKQGITVIDSKGNAVNTGIQLGRDGRTVTITAPEGGYTSGESYTLNIGTKAHSNKGKALKKGYKLNFNIKNNSSDSTVITFKDKNLEQAIRDVVKKPAGDIYKSDVEGIKNLNLSFKGITNLEGIENLVNLTHLRLANTSEEGGYVKSSTNNQIEDITPLSKLTKLIYLDISANEQIKDITALKSLVNMQWLGVFRTGISDISVLENMKDLYMLTAADNHITDITPLKNLTKFQYLYLHDNNISDISSLKNLTNLKRLYLAKNQIKDFSPASSYYSNLEEKDFTLITEPVVEEKIVFPDKYLEYHVRKAIGKETGDIYKSDVEKIEELKVDSYGFYDKESKKDYSSISNLEGIQYLTNLKKLKLLIGEANDLKPMSNLTKLEYLDFNLHSSTFNMSHPVKDFTPLNSLTNLQYLRLNLLRYTTVNISDFKNLVNLTQLDLRYCNVNSLNGIENMTQLKEFSFGCLGTHNPTKDFSVDLTSLSRMSLLEKLVIDNGYEAGAIRSLNPLKNLKNLKDLVLIGVLQTTANPLDVSPLADVVNLERLTVEHSDLSDISGLANLTNLKYLNLRNNPLANINPLEKLINLKELNLSNSSVKDISVLRNLINLEKLDVRNQRFSTYEYIYASNEIKDITPLLNLTNLKVLYLRNNPIGDISALEKLVNLKELNLGNCNVEDISVLKNLTNLESLGLENFIFEPYESYHSFEDIYAVNKISNIEPLRRLTNLKRLYLSGNPITNFEPVSSYLNNLKYKDF